MRPEGRPKPLLARELLAGPDVKWGAKAVAAVLKRGLSDSNRVDIEGKGPDVPISSNATPEGRAKNRRVEIFIERSE